eukprot:TRINITY_DN1025_c0_g1_i1.p1 TRINITY_DN1025_c0_g1~~TRINITY_DN1025_c0_g1_i1.p1  ORF type:complete len:291 (-),score=77.87 TRINITY_DN1025_c0_g1_i1:164-1036(-)
MNDSLSDKFNKMDVFSRYYTVFFFVPNPIKRIRTFQGIHDYFYFFEKASAKIRYMQDAIDAIRHDEDFHTICQNIKKAFVGYMTQYEEKTLKKQRKVLNDDGMHLRYLTTIASRKAFYNGEEISWLRYLVQLFMKDKPDVLNNFLSRFAKLEEVREIKDIDQYGKDVDKLKVQLEDFKSFSERYRGCGPDDAMAEFLAENVPMADQKYQELLMAFANLKEDCETACEELNLPKQIPVSEVYLNKKSPYEEAKAKVEGLQSELKKAKEAFADMTDEESAYKANQHPVHRNE